MTGRIARYLERRADLLQRPFVSGPLENVQQAVVIPVLAERDHLAHTLEQLARNPAKERAHTLVLCVVNNRAVPFASPEDIADNQNTLHDLEMRIADSPLRLACIDASSPGHVLSPKSGVGLARKLGLDWATAILLQNGHTRAPLICLDADTLVEENYLSALAEHFQQETSWAASIQYAHRLEGISAECAAIRCYELYLRYHILGLRYAGSPYAFHSVGSAMACRMDAYVAAGGMNQRQAGEDFYFLQQLAKTGHVHSLRTTTVHPSCRPSHRVPFGTGQRVRRYLSETENEYLLDDPRIYRILKQWLEGGTVLGGDSVSGLMAHAGEIAAELSTFLIHRGFPHAWETIQNNAKNSRQRIAQFHRWFDGFETVKLVHYLRDHGYPPQDMGTAFGTLLAWSDMPGMVAPSADFNRNYAAQDELLACLRTQGI